MAEQFEVTWNDKVIADLTGAAFEGLEIAAEHLLQVSSQLAPHEEGDLERSGEVTADRSSGTVAVSFDRPYAVRQHEELTWQHASGRQAKYLEKPMTTEAATMLRLAAGPGREKLGG